MKHIKWICRLAAIGSICSLSGCLALKDSNVVADIDGNVYRTVEIGKYEWMAENLRTTTYNTGEKIPYITENNIWVMTDSGAFCWYNNEEKNKDSLGALYNWYAVNTGNLCPCGWRVPTDEEWKRLEGFTDSLYGVGNGIWNEVGSRGYNAGSRLKAVLGWRPGWLASDRFGFSALPGGEYLSSFHGLGTSGFWWSRTEKDSLSAWYRNLVYSLNTVDRNSHPKRMGFSVRCLRDK
jgi:uncharacterized protein (TIGR02145 family)